MTVPEYMAAVYLTGYGGFDKLEYRTDVPTPRPRAGEVLIGVTAAGMNNTDINTRTGWYNRQVETGTTASGGAAGFEVKERGMGEWAGDIKFPRIQGADVTGTIAAVGDGVNTDRLGERVVCNPYFTDPEDEQGLDSAGFLGADYDGGFAQFTLVPAQNAVTVDAGESFSDEQIATLPCSGGTAMNMLLMARVAEGDRMLVTGASGGVGTFLIQIGKYLGAKVTAVASNSKHEQVMALGADAVIDTHSGHLINDARQASKSEPYTVIADVVGGEQFGTYLSLLKRGGRYVTAGAIAGPVVRLDLRTLYLKNLEFYGSTVYRRDTFDALLQILCDGGIKPKVDSVWPLSKICQAQAAFLQKQHVGSMVLNPKLG